MKCDNIADLEKFLSIQEQALGTQSAEVATTTAKLGDLYLNAGQLDQAEGFYQRALKIRENLTGVHSDEILDSQRSLDSLSDARAKAAGKCAAKPNQRSVTPNSEVSLNSQAKVINHPVASERLAASSEDITAPGSNSEIAISAKIKAILDAIHDAELELELMRPVVGKRHPTVADMLTRVADLYCRLKMFSKMEPILVEALQIREAVCGSAHPAIATELKNLARLYIVQERYALAEPLLKRALAIREENLGKNHPRVADIKEQYAVLMRKTNRIQQAEELERQVREVRQSDNPRSSTVHLQAIVKAS
jgi:tetratricopeptide (TPR) repeat protein